MNLNLFRTILTWVAIGVTAVPTIFGCTTSVSGAVDCSTSILPPQYAGMLSMGLLVLNQILKAFQGGTVGAGLVAPTVVVNGTGDKGTVTPAQVAK